MIVTRSWLNEFVDISDISDETLYKSFNAIGLEVDSIKSYEIPSRVVVGKILSCERHPDADKLNVCKIDIGDGIKQIVCGAANVLDAEFVAVATIGAILPDNFEIASATLRGVDSEGMVCAAAELGLPDTGKGIMILDESIGTLEIGRELRSYEKVADTVIELELTANRGDCLSIHGVARDLSVALELELKAFKYQKESSEIGIASFVDLQVESGSEVDLHYNLIEMREISMDLIIALRLGMVEVALGDKLANMLAYATHATGVILRAYATTNLIDEGERLMLQVHSESSGIVSVDIGGEQHSLVGVNQSAASMANDSSVQILLEASYRDPDLLVERLAQRDDVRDDLYYRTSRGSEPDLLFGMEYLFGIIQKHSSILCYSGHLGVVSSWDPTTIALDAKEICSIIGEEIETSKITTILRNLKFEIHSSGGENFSVVVPRFRHDIKHLQDVTEEIVRIVGIDNITAKPIRFVESNRLTTTTDRYKFKKALRHRAASAGLYENVSYIFSDRKKLEEYGFDLVDEKLDLTNPIAEDLNTLRSTLLINLLDAVERNVNYTKRSIGLFEIGTVFGSKREEREVLSVIFSGQNRVESVANSGKPTMVSFASFIEKIGSIIGNFELVECSYSNGLLHPYQSADILYRGIKCGFVSKLHPSAQESYGIYDTFVAQIDMEALLPQHINATDISKFQGVYKDLSIVVEKSLTYAKVSQEIASLDLPLLRKYYPVDIYEDEELGEQKSLTIRFFIQSMEKTLKEKDIEKVISPIMSRLEQSCQATLR